MNIGLTYEFDSIEKMLCQIQMDMKLLNEYKTINGCTTLSYDYIPFSLRADSGTITIDNSSSNIFYAQENLSLIYTFIHDFKYSMIYFAKSPIEIIMNSICRLYTTSKQDIQTMDLVQISKPALVAYRHI